ncbi:MAG: polysaccharide biosynthesis protein [Ruminococcaceae bacterium]|nr:polysaccharide biosynthesis protein [Oscillospiraceae bacterium]
MAGKQNQMFMKGALILLIANIVVKVIGAVFKIPLTYILDEEGMAMFAQSYQIYGWLFVIATAGFPVAISKMIAESRALGKVKEVKRIHLASVIIMGTIGLIGTAILFFGARPLAFIMELPEAEMGIRAIAPALLFVTLMSIYRGFFQGHQDMMPTALSEVVEALGKLIIGYSLAAALLDTGLEYASAGAVFGVSAGAFLGFSIIYVIYLFRRRNLYRADELSAPGQSRSVGAIIKSLLRIAIPITIGASVFSLTSVIDAAMVMRRLKDAGFDHEHAKFLWGAYSGYAQPMFNLPATMVTSISVSLVPAISGALAIGKQKTAQRTTELSLRLAWLFSLPCAVGLAIMAAPVLYLVYSNSNAAPMLSILGYAVALVSMVSVANAILQATGHIWIPVRNMLIGGAIKIAVNYTLVGMPAFNIHGAPVGTILCYVTILILNLASIRRIIGTKLSVVDFIVKPVLSVAVMAAAVLAVYGALPESRLSTLVAIGAGAVVYAAMLFVIGCIREQDVEMIPKAEKLLPIMKKLRLIRK